MIICGLDLEWFKQNIFWGLLISGIPVIFGLVFFIVEYIRFLNWKRKKKKKDIYLKFILGNNPYGRMSKKEIKIAKEYQENKLKNKND